MRALSVSRSGTNVALKWEVAGTTTKKFRVYFRLADGSTTYLLSPVSLPSSTRTLTLSDQSLTQVCGDFFVKIVLSDSPLTESAASPYNRLGSAQSGISGPLNPCGGGSGSNPISYTFANSYHHRDHLGSLRVETDEAGNRSVKRDYYAFGIEMPNGFESSAQAATRRQFTEAERGVYNGLDYMMARFCSGNAGRFFSPDVVVGNTANPQSWNRYSFVMNNPVMYTDPSGKMAMHPDQTPMAMTAVYSGFGHFGTADSSTTVTVVATSTSDGGSGGFKDSASQALADQALAAASTETTPIPGLCPTGSTVASIVESASTGDVPIETNLSDDARLSLQETQANGSKRTALEVTGPPGQVEEVVTGINTSGKYDVSVIAGVSTFESPQSPQARIVGTQTITIYTGNANLQDFSPSTGSDPVKTFVHELAHTYRGILRNETWVRTVLCE